MRMQKDNILVVVWKQFDLWISWKGLIDPRVRGPHPESWTPLSNGSHSYNNIRNLAPHSFHIKFVSCSCSLISQGGDRVPHIHLGIEADGVHHLRSMAYEVAHGREKKEVENFLWAQPSSKAQPFFPHFIGQNSVTPLPTLARVPGKPSHCVPRKKNIWVW